MVKRNKTSTEENTGYAVYRLVKYLKTRDDAETYMEKEFKKADKSGDTKLIWKCEKITLWGTPFEKP